MATAVITGAGQGLGRADALRLTADGFDVVCLDLSGDAARETAEMVGGTAFEGDVTDRDAVHAVAEQVPECYALVNNAGIWRFHSILDMTEDAGPLGARGERARHRLVHPGLRAEAEGGRRRQHREHVVGRGVDHSPGLGLYPATKSAVESLTKTMALELGPTTSAPTRSGPA